MKRFFLVVLLSLGVFFSKEIHAQAFFDTDNAEKFFTLGGRIGFNTSTRSFPKDNYANSIITTWGTGFNVGVIANLNFKEYLTLQPGFFYESRSNYLVNIVDYINHVGFGDTYYEKNHLRAYYFTIPVMGIIKFNLAENIKWSVEFGPYLQFALKQNGENNVRILYRPNQENLYAYYFAQQKSFDVGLKMGMGLTFYQHYYVGFHYLAGLCNAWSMPSGGKHKSWMFTVGYDF